MPTAIGLALLFIKSCSLSAWKKDGTCSASVRGLRMPYTILHCGFGIGYHSLFFGHSMNTIFNCISFFFFFRINLSYRAFTISKKSQGGGRVELYVNCLYKGFLDRPRFFLLRCFKLSIFNNKCTFFFQHWLWWCFCWGGGGISHTEQLSIIFLQHWHHN